MVGSKGQQQVVRPRLVDASQHSRLCRGWGGLGRRSTMRAHGAASIVVLTTGGSMLSTVTPSSAPATVGGAGCSRGWCRLQPWVVQAAAVGGAGCNRRWCRLQQ